MVSSSASVLVGEGVEDDGDQGPDYLDTDDLGVEASDGGDLKCVDGVGEEEYVWGSRAMLLRRQQGRTRGHLRRPHKESLVLALPGGARVSYRWRRFREKAG
jgi:hypothetical protein